MGSRLYNVNSVVSTRAHAWAPFAILPIFVSLEKIDRSLLEAATDLGDGPLRRFLRVTLPLSLPGVIAAALIVFIPTVGDYVTPRLVGRSEEHTSELQSLMRISYAVFCLKKKNNKIINSATSQHRH